MDKTLLLGGIAYVSANLTLHVIDTSAHQSTNSILAPLKSNSSLPIFKIAFKNNKFYFIYIYDIHIQLFIMMDEITDAVLEKIMRINRFNDLGSLRPEGPIILIIKKLS